MKALYTDGKKVTIRKIFCLGLNYSDHINEMSHKRPDKPVIFIKPDTAVCYDQAEVQIPAISDNLHYETEMTVILKKGGKNIPQDKALDCVGGFGIGIDMTLRDCQQKAKESGLPWT